MRVFISRWSLAITALLLACSDAVSPSASGSLRVAATTTGTPPDADGYVVHVNHNGNGLDSRVAVNGSVTLPDLPTGAHLVRLLDIAANCTVNGVNPLPVTIQANRVADAAFQIQCAEPLVGAIEVTTIGEGYPPGDPGGYRVALDGGRDQHIGPNATIRFTLVPVGIHTVALLEVTPYCGALVPGAPFPSLGPVPPQSVSVGSGAVTRVTFSVFCLG